MYDKSLIDELDHKLELFKRFTNQSTARLYIVDYFFNLRNEIDLKTEQLVYKFESKINELNTNPDAVESASEKEQRTSKYITYIKDLNERRSEMLNELIQEEKLAVDDFERTFNRSVFDTIGKKYENFQIKSKRLDELSLIVSEIDYELVQIQKSILNNKTFIFKTLDDEIKCGILLIIDMYLSNEESILIR